MSAYEVDLITRSVVGLIVGMVIGHFLYLVVRRR